MTPSSFALRHAGLPASAAITVTVTGDIDITNADDFVESLQEGAGSRLVIVDLSGLRYLDSAGFAALDRLLASESIVIVVSPDSHIHKAATLMELPFFPDIATACHAFQARVDPPSA